MPYYEHNQLCKGLPSPAPFPVFTGEKYHIDKKKKRPFFRESSLTQSTLSTSHKALNRIIKDSLVSCHKSGQITSTHQLGGKYLEHIH